MQGTLTRVREAKGLKQVELARRAGISESLLSRIENGQVKRPSFETVRRLADALDTPCEELFPAAGSVEDVA